MPSMQTLRVLPEDYALCRMEGTAPWPAAPEGPGFYSATRTGKELSVVCPAQAAPSGARVQAGFRCLEVEGPFELTSVGVVASVTAPLARAGISVFAMSTYDTDYLLVKEETLEAAIRALETDGHKVRR
jgi:uncharacterized protein